MYKIQLLKNCCCFLALLLISQINPAYSQDKAAVLDLTWRGLGGKQSWQDAQYFLFHCQNGIPSFFPNLHSYIWDRSNGNVRFEGQTPDQQALVILFNLDHKQGKVFIDKQPSEGTHSADLLQQVRQTFLLDAFWLFIPTSLQDSASIKLGDQELIGSNRYNVLEIRSFKENSLPPLSRMFIDNNTGRLYQRQSFDRAGNIQYNFQVSSFKDVGGGLILPTELVDQEKGIAIRYPLVSALINVDPSKFTTL